MNLNKPSQLEPSLSKIPINCSLIDVIFKKKKTIITHNLRIENVITFKKKVSNLKLLYLKAVDILCY